MTMNAAVLTTSAAPRVIHILASKYRAAAAGRSNAPLPSAQVVISISLVSSVALWEIEGLLALLRARQIIALC
jgi:hypothetical protein